MDIIFQLFLKRVQAEIYKTTMLPINYLFKWGLSDLQYRERRKLDHLVGGMP